MGLREEKKEKTNSDILHSIGELLMEKDIEEITVSEIAKRAQISIATLYNYFDGKEEMLLEHLNRMIGVGKAKADKVIVGSHASPADAVFALLNVYLSDTESQKRLPLRQLYAAGLKRSMNGGTSVFKDTVLDQLVALLEKLVSEGLVRNDLNVRNTALIFFGMMHNAMAELSFQGGASIGDIAERVRENISLLFMGIGAGNEVK